ncbi:AAA+ ATPase domain-containing protein [Cynara cardunculus var. scolymus]|uniref:AAA+ ATPase domain-containing protein n=1 Tax=Cynara cardunculus var. scolymus TaxID=59895 RepID=A0A118K5A5_CYNCS|nr:AAA+ ATPase domain-containing protein [Cynara cardunculus var. scolymus]
MVVRSVARDYLPPEFRDYLYLGFRNFINKFSIYLTMVIYEFNGFRDNEIYNATELYVAARMSTDFHRLKVIKNPTQKNITVTMEVNEDFTDTFNGAKFYWSSVSKKTPTRQYDGHDSRTSRTDLRWLELTFHRDHKDLVLNEYLPFILNEAEMKKKEQKTVKLFTVKTNSSYSKMGTAKWKSVNLDHPASFATLAMDADMKEMVKKDLDRFVARREYYRKVGKAWKRGYLLHGPPGTGKSSLIAAIVNYLNFDIYDLELTDIKSNSELRSLLVATANRSILVVEDIDCSVELHDRVAVEAAKAVTLSGFLNFVDGLWSSCGDERIIIFTTNRKNKLDPALIRPGRMDLHIHMSYCTPCGFRLLASNYLGITQHDLFNQIEDLMSEVNVTPAEVAEQLLKDDDPSVVLDGLIKFIDVKRKMNEEAKAKRKEKKEAKRKMNEEAEAKRNEKEKEEAEAEAEAETEVETARKEKEEAKIKVTKKEKEKAKLDAEK